MPSTFVHALLPSSCLVSLKKRLPDLARSEWLRLFFVAMIIGNLPDLDTIPASLFKAHARDIHREWGHNIFALVFWTFVGMKLLARFVSNRITAKQALWISASLVFSHVLLDSMGDLCSDGLYHGVPLFWPISSYEFSLPLHLFQAYETDQSKNMLLAHFTAMTYWKGAILNELTSSVLLYSIWFVGLRSASFVESLILRRRHQARISSHLGTNH